MCDQPSRSYTIEPIWAVIFPQELALFFVMAYIYRIPSCFDPAVYNGHWLTSFSKVAVVEWKVWLHAFFIKGLVPTQNEKEWFWILKNNNFPQTFFWAKCSMSEPCDISRPNHSIANFVAHVITWKFGSSISRVLNIAVIYRLKN